MKLIWHLIKNDVRRDRWALLLWAALIVAQIGLGLALLQDPGDDRTWLKGMEFANGGIVIVGALTGYVLVARLVLADPLLGTDMFWATKPIGRRRLLLAKAGAAVLLFAMLPVVIMTPWWLWCGFTARDLFWSAVDTFGWQLLMIAPALLVASLTNELGRVLLWSLLLFIGGLMCFGLLANFANSAADRSDPTRLFLSTAYTRIWLAVLVGLVCSAIVVAHQYLTRHLARSIGLTVAGVVLVVATGLLAPLDWAPAISRLTQPAESPEFTAAAGAIKVEAGASMPSNRPGLKERRTIQEPSIVTEIYFQGLPENLSVSSGLSRQTWRLPDGMSVSRTSYTGTGFLPSEQMLLRTLALTKPAPDPETEAYFKARRDELAARVQARRESLGQPRPMRYQMRPPSKPGTRNLVHSSVPEALIKRAQAEPTAYEATLRCVASQPVIVAELPLTVGAEAGSRSVRFKLMWVTDERPVLRQGAMVMTPRDRAEIATSILITAPRLRLSGLGMVKVLAPDWLPDLSRGEVWTVNRTTGDLVRCGGFGLQSTRSALVAGVAFGWSQPQVRSAVLSRDGKPVPRDPLWQEHASLVFVAEETVGHFTATVKSDRHEFGANLWVEQPEEFPGSRN